MQKVLLPSFQEVLVDKKKVLSDHAKQLIVILQIFQLSQAPNEIRYFSCEFVVRCPAACTRKYITLRV
jgi:hypothetical protein